MSWKRWKLGVAVSIVLSLLVAGSGLTAGMNWKSFVAVFCTAAITHLGAFLKDHPIEQITTDSNPTAFVKK